VHPDAATLAHDYPPPTLALDLKKVRGFVPPPGVAKLKDEVTLNLGLGAHYFFTLVQHREPAFDLVRNFLQFSTTVAGRHVFTGSSLGDDTETNQAYSNLFAKVTGVAFMSEYAEATWFASMSRVWDSGLDVPGGKVTFKKRHPSKDGPDFVSAPFDPAASGCADPLYVLEFKGRTGTVKFTHKVFSDWRHQAVNIRATGPAGPVNLKSWILVFNYAFEHGKGRECSALLVEDPPTEQADVPPMKRVRGSIETVVREHLSRQCPRFGVPRLAPAVLAGRPVEDLRALPTVFRVRSQGLADRRYLGAFANLGPNGELLWTPDPERKLLHGDYDILVHGGDDDPLYLRIRIGSHSRPSTHDIHVSGSPSISAAQIAALVRSATDRRGAIFVGQDATMIRASMRTKAGQGLDDPAFTVAMEVRGDRPAGRLVEDGAPEFVQLLRNGSIIADANLVDAEKASAEWWRST
jgi:hypothetical protein